MKRLTQSRNGRQPEPPGTVQSSSSSSILQKGRRKKKNLGRKSMIVALIVFLAVFVRLIPDAPATNRVSFTLQEAKPLQKILLLAGPHKAGSSTIQYDSFLLSEFAENWTFIDPWSSERDNFKVVELDHSKHFAVLLLVLRGQLNDPLFVNPPVDRDVIIEAFRQDILNNWNNGKSITLGSEEIDFAVADYKAENGVSGDQVLDGLLSILPQNTKDVTEVIVAYRSPRAKHFVSLWKEVGVTLWNQTLQEFIFHSEAYLHFHVIDIMPLVEKFLERGFKVVLVDIGGVKVKKLKMFQLLACHLMQEACDASTNVPLFLKSKLERSEDLQSALYNDVNVRTEGVMDLNEEQIQQIEETMLRYDCGYKDAVFRNDLLNVIFDDTFSENMNNCDVTGTERLGRKELWRSIQRIADPVRAQEENMRNL